MWISWITWIDPAMARLLPIHLRSARVDHLDRRWPALRSGTRSGCSPLPGCLWKIASGPSRAATPYCGERGRDESSAMGEKFHWPKMPGCTPQSVDAGQHSRAVRASLAQAPWSGWLLFRRPPTLSRGARSGTTVLRGRPRFGAAVSTAAAAGSAAAAIGSGAAAAGSAGTALADEAGRRMSTPSASSTSSSLPVTSLRCRRASSGRLSQPS